MKILRWLPAYLLVGCHLAAAPRAMDAIGVAGVPAGPHAAEHCGAAVLRDVLAFHGWNLEQEVIAREVYDGRMGGSSNAAMLAFLDRRAIPSWAGEGTEALLREALGRRRPPIVFLAGEPGEPGHYAVVHGLLEAPPRWVLGSPRGGLEVAPAARLLERWQRGHAWTLVVDPKSPLPPALCEFAP
jgi:hypothetical protein